MFENKKRIPVFSIAVILMLAYAYSRLSWSFFLPSIAWAIGLSVAIILLGLNWFFFGKLKVRKDINILWLALMLFVIIFNNNYDIMSSGALVALLPYICVFVLYSICPENGRWIKPSINFMVIIGCFYVIFTIICNIYTDLYYSVIYPLMSKNYNTTYTPHPSAGFTAHYSTNGIYIAMMFIAMMGMTFFRDLGHETRFSKVKWTLFVLTTISLLICGKRGILLALIVAVFLGYLNYTVKKKRGNAIKIIAAVIVILVLINIAAIFIPSINYTLSRFSDFDFRTDNNTANRFEYWQYAWSKFSEKPFFGWGWRWFKNCNTIAKVDVHNCYLQLLTENGIIGAIPFYLFFICSFYRAWKLSIFVRKNNTNLDNRDIGYIYLSFIGQIYTLIYMVEGTGLYSPECLFSYIIYCCIIEYYRNNVSLVQGINT